MDRAAVIRGSNSLVKYLVACHNGEEDERDLTDDEIQFLDALKAWLIATECSLWDADEGRILDLPMAGFLFCQFGLAEQVH
jgi:hypothetical protein